MYDEKISFGKYSFLSKTHFAHEKSCCRFYPTCSSYALSAVEKYGPLKGSWLSAKRILKCHPFHKGGYDPLK